MNHSAAPPGRIAIVGAGALGSLIAGRLARVDAAVVLLNRPSPHLDAIRAAGLVLIEPDGAAERIAVAVSSDPASVANAAAVVVAVKTWATDAALRAVRAWLAPATWVVSLQNGLGNDERIRAALGPSINLALGATLLGAVRLEPGVVRAGGVGPTLFGAPGHAPPAALRDLAARFSAAGMPAAAIADIEPAIWRKLAVNAAINGLTALAAVPNGAIAADPELRAAATAIAREVEAVARAEGCEIGDVERALFEVAVATATNHSSMRRDLETGAPTEVDAIHGAVVTRAARHGLAVPANQTIAAILRARSRSAHEEQQ
ncbi:MAG TPA: ketopantoate reductase family protein [Thermomicrobiales bacterium]|nr:ketopantoate reductase family protein [Thermomicrobiales bacterium]